MSEMARLTFGRLREAWTGEATDFTPLLAEQVDQRRSPGRARSGPCCIHWSSPPCCPPLAPRARTPTRSSACSACWVSAFPRPATPISPTSATSPAMSCCTSSAGAPSPRTPAARRRDQSPDQPARAATDLLHHRLGRRHRDPGHAVRHAARGPTDHAALRHGQGEPQPARRPRRRRLPRRHEYRLTRPAAAGKDQRT